MADSKNIPPGSYTLELGSTFSDPKRGEQPPQYHTLRYDFKPKSVASSESETYLAYGANADVHVAVPTDGNNLTVFKGSKKEAKPKECLLFFDKKTGVVRLEKISSNIQVKKTRDVDQRTEAVLRSEMARLRTVGVEKSKPGTAITAEDDSSSSSSDSSDSDSGSDDDNSDKRSRNDSNSSTSDMEKQLLASVNAISSPPASKKQNLNLSFDSDIDMPNLDTHTPQPSHISRPPPQPVAAPVSHDDFGLNLSESSDEDD